MGHGREDDEDVHLGAQVDVRARAPSGLAANASAPSASASTLLKKFTFGDDVLLAEPVFAELDEEVVARVAVKVVARLLVALAPVPRLDERRVAEWPASVSCQPQVSATIEQSTRPMSEKRTRPVVRKAVYCAFSVSGML